MFLHRSPWLLKTMFPDFLWAMPADGKTLYLTFDDGPVPEVTPRVLETLESAGAKGTFFCIGENVMKHPAVFEKVKEGGHAIGNHTHNHLNGWKTEDGNYLENIARCQQVLSEKRSPTRLFRPPYGRIKRSQSRRVIGDFKVIMWDVLSGDFSPQLTPERCLRETIGNVRAGSIVVFHDSIKAAKRMEYALPRVLDHFGSLGYAFAALPMT